MIEWVTLWSEPGNMLHGECKQDGRHAGVRPGAAPASTARGVWGGWDIRYGTEGHR